MTDAANVPDPTFWFGRRVLITGHTGFKGSWLAFWLAKMGASVSGYALAPATKPSAFALMQIDKRVTSYTGDIRDAVMLDEAVRKSAAEIVFHLAAQSTVRRAHSDPLETFGVNVMGTVRLLESLRRAPSVAAVVVVTSDKCYAENRGLYNRPYVEGDPLGGAEAYAASKACAEIVTASYRQSQFADTAVRIATARAGNVIGGGDWTPDRLVTDLVRSLAAGRSLELRYPLATRPWQHVLEPLCGYLLLAERLVGGRGAYTEPWNFGPDAADVTTVEEFVDRFERAWGTSVRRERSVAANPHEALHLLLDSRAATRALNWQCRLSLDAAIKWTVDWFKTVTESADAVEMTDGQIDRYLATTPSTRIASGMPIRTESRLHVI